MTNKAEETHQFSGPVWTWSDDVRTHCKDHDASTTYTAVYIIPTYIGEFIFDLLNAFAVYIFNTTAEYIDGQSHSLTSR